ncbi:hypothetical protein ACFQWF_09775 [Methylorubrum suomiense]
MTAATVSDGALGLLRADLAEMRASQRDADQRLHATMEGVQALLSRLSDQLDRPAAATMTSAGALAAAAPDRAGSTFELALPESLAEVPSRERAAHERPAAPKGAPHKSAAPMPARPRPAVRPEDVLSEVTRSDDELLEPGAGRPAPGRPAAEAPLPAGSDIKTSFIAAARRAAQAAQAEAETEQPLTTRLRERISGGASHGAKSGAIASEGAQEGAVSRMRGGFEKRRRTLLLGLAAVVLALGAYQAFQLNGGAPSEEAAAPSERNAVAAAPDATKIAAGKGAEVKGGEGATADAKTAEQSPADRGAAPPAAARPPSQNAAPLADPATTQSLAEAAPRPDETGRKAAPHAMPHVASMAGLGADLAGLPTALAPSSNRPSTATAPRSGNSPAAPSRGGLSRDLAVAAKLYERLASAGYAPAQFKLGNAYEKGSGVVRDIAQAKSWYGRAADMGNTRAMHNLAVLHAENPAANGRPDFVTAASAFRRAAEYGVRDSQYNLAVLYARGLGVSQDLVQSYLWFSAAAAQGDEEAGRKRDEVAGKLNPADLARGRELVAGFKPKAADPAANEAPTPKLQAAAPPTSLIGAPSPNLPSANALPKRAGV